MPITRSRRGLAIGLAVTTAAIAITTVTLNGAYASHPGAANSPLTTYDRVAIHFANGTAIPAHSNFAEGAWSPDGSRFAYIDNFGTAGPGAVVSVRANDPDGDASSAGGSAITLVNGLAGSSARHQPTWSADGAELYYSEQVRPDGTWNIGASTSAPGWGDRMATPDDGWDYQYPDAGPTGVVVAERQRDDGTGNPTGTPEVVAITPSTATVTPVIDNASQPAVSPDGGRVAFVRSDGTNNQIWTSNMTGGDLTQITANAADHLTPTWSPDGSTIAFITTNGIATASATGSDAANPTPVTGLPFGLPQYQPLNKNHVVELAGSDRFATAIDISQSHWATAGATGDNREAAKSVTLSRSDTFADAVSGSALAAAKHGPLLLTPPTSLNAGTKAEIKRVLGSTTSTVYLLGGTAAISTSVENSIKAMGYTTKRLSGSDRYATSVAIAKAISASPAIFLVATGRNFPDALSAGAAAGSYAAAGTPAVVILSNDETMPSSTETYLESFVSAGTLNAFLGAVGDQANAALKNAGWSVYNVEAGPNRYVTAQKVAIEFFGGNTVAGVTTGLNWPDALAGGALLGTVNGPLLITGGSSTLDSNAQGLLSDGSGSISTAFIFGGTLPSSINGQIGVAISGPAGFDANLPSTASSQLKSAAGSSVIGSGSRSKLPANATKAQHKG